MTRLASYKVSEASFSFLLLYPTQDVKVNDDQLPGANRHDINHISHDVRVWNTNTMHKGELNDSVHINCAVHEHFKWGHFSRNII